MRAAGKARGLAGDQLIARPAGRYLAAYFVHFRLLQN
jgi:hypothetical protein